VRSRAKHVCPERDLREIFAELTRHRVSMQMIFSPTAKRKWRQIFWTRRVWTPVWAQATKLGPLRHHLVRVCGGRRVHFAAHVARRSP